MALFGDSVPREMYEDMRAQRDQALVDRRAIEVRYSALVSQTLDIKRHEMGMVPTGFDAARSDPTTLLGPKTNLAIDNFAGGDPELRRLLITRAIYETQSASSGDGADGDAVDTHVAQLITAGDA